VGLGNCRTNADSQWNPVYNAFHRIFGCGNKTIRRYYFKRDLDAAKLGPALGQGGGKQTPSDRTLFFRANLLHSPDVKGRGDLDLVPCAFWVLGTCEKKTAAQWQLSKKNVFRTQKKSDFHTAQRFSFRKYQKSAQT